MLFGPKIKAEREIYIELDVPVIDHRILFYYDDWEGKPFAFTSEKNHVRVQIKLLLIFLKSGVQIWL